MSEVIEYAQGIPSWTDLMAPDLPAAKEFYTALFGWDYFVGPPETGGYTQALVDGRTVCGLMQPMEGQGDTPVAWTTYLATDDADATLKATAENGGQAFTEVIDVMGEGRMWVGADPTGAAFGVWEAGRHRGAQHVNKPGGMIWNELATTDAPRARDFYAKVFGVEISDAFDGFDYTTVKVGGRDVGGIFTAEVPHPFWGVYFAVSDTDETVRIATERGAKVLKEPSDSPYGRMATLQDPQGAVFSLMSVS